MQSGAGILQTYIDKTVNKLNCKKVCDILSTCCAAEFQPGTFKKRFFKFGIGSQGFHFFIMGRLAVV